MQEGRLCLQKLRRIADKALLIYTVLTKCYEKLHHLRI